MARIKKIDSKKIYLREWLRWKPYDQQILNYDKEYVALANEVMQVLKEYHSWFGEFSYGNQAYKELALLLTSYFEDFISEIGIWKAFIQINKKQLGYFLPFYSMADYDPEYLNPQDFSFLIWFHMNHHTKRTFGPDSPDILELGEVLYEVLELQIEEVYATDFYEHLFSIPDDIPFFDLKHLLKWFALESYLPGLEFGQKFKEASTDFLEKHPYPEMGEEYVNKILYTIQDDYIYSRRSSLSALTSIEWFAEIAHCSEEMKKNIFDLKKRATGTFLYQGHNETHYQFQNLHSDQFIEVTKESVTLNTRQIEKGDVNLFSIIRWKGDWWLSGSWMSWGKQDPAKLKDSKEDLQSIPFYLYSEEKQQQLRADTKKMEHLFLSFFGKQLVLFEKQAPLQKAMQEFLDFQNEHMVKDKVAGKKAIQKFRDRYKKYSNGIDLSETNLDKQSSAGLFFVSGSGVIIDPMAPKIIHFLQKKKLVEKEKAQLFFSLLGEGTHPQIAQYIMENYPTKNLVFPIPLSQVDALKYASFFMRYFNPDDFDEPKPNTRYMPES